MQMLLFNEPEVEDSFVGYSMKHLSSGTETDWTGNVSPLYVLYLYLWR